jgi:hypothetical protein
MSGVVIDDGNGMLEEAQLGALGLLHEFLDVGKSREPMEGMVEDIPAGEWILTGSSYPLRSSGHPAVRMAIRRF